ncbi:hypothetical protein [Paenirhodobacter sp.]|uniref:hypothetical protein n=1 Tax=Paenirhodobacter sp. TaxID=1965326 RepID=UPI003B3F6723
MGVFAAIMIERITQAQETGIVMIDAEPRAEAARASEGASDGVKPGGSKGDGDG